MISNLSILPKNEQPRSLTPRDNSLKVDFLVFTRFENERLDYKFYFASQDENLTELIKRNLIPQESPSELPNEAFFIYKNYCILTVAELWMNSNDKVRKDSVGRDILRRLFFVWDFSRQPAWLKYEHLLVLLHNLQMAARINVDVIPNDNKDATPKRIWLEFKRSDLEDGWSKIASVYKVDYSKFLQSNLKNIQLRAMNITTPGDWTFDKQILLFRGFNISDNPYFIWHKVFNKISPKFEKLLTDHRWIASSDKEERHISLYHATRGSLIEKIDANEETALLEDDFQKTRGAAKIYNEAKAPETSAAAASSSFFAAAGGGTETPYTHELHDLEITNSVDFLKREVSFFVCSAPVFNSSILDSWNNLLNEIRQHYSNCSKKQKFEWIRRLDIVRHILEEEIDITDCDRFAYESSFSLLTKRLLELIEHE